MFALFVAVVLLGLALHALAHPPPTLEQVRAAVRDELRVALHEVAEDLDDLDDLDDVVVVRGEA